MFATSDGYLNLAAIGQTMWKRLCEALDVPQLVDEPGFGSDPERVRNRARVNAAVGSASSRRAARPSGPNACSQAGVPCGPIHRSTRCSPTRRSGTSASRGRCTTRSSATSKSSAMPMQFSRHPRSEGPLAAAPHQGDDTDAILAELGYSAERIAQLRAAHVV